MKVILDRSRCEGHAVCAELCPEVFRMADDDLVEIIKPDVPPELEQDVGLAVESCPEGCLSLGEE